MEESSDVQINQAKSSSVEASQVSTIHDSEKQNWVKKNIDSSDKLLKGEGNDESAFIPAVSDQSYVSADDEVSLFLEEDESKSPKNDLVATKDQEKKNIDYAETKSPLEDDKNPVVNFDKLESLESAESFAIEGADVSISLSNEENPEAEKDSELSKSVTTKPMTLLSSAVEPFQSSSTLIGCVEGLDISPKEMEKDVIDLEEESSQQHNGEIEILCEKAALKDIQEIEVKLDKKDCNEKQELVSMDLEEEKACLDEKADADIEEIVHKENLEGSQGSEFMEEISKQTVDSGKKEEVAEKPVLKEPMDEKGDAVSPKDREKDSPEKCENGDKDSSENGEAGDKDNPEKDEKESEDISEKLEKEVTCKESPEISKEEIKDIIEKCDKEEQDKDSPENSQTMLIDLSEDESDLDNQKSCFVKLNLLSTTDFLKEKSIKASSADQLHYCILPTCRVTLQRLPSHLLPIGSNSFVIIASEKNNIRVKRVLRKVNNSKATNLKRASSESKPGAGNFKGAKKSVNARAAPNESRLVTENLKGTKKMRNVETTPNEPKYGPGSLKKSKMDENTGIALNDSKSSTESPKRGKKFESTRTIQNKPKSGAENLKGAKKVVNVLEKTPNESKSGPQILNRAKNVENEETMPNESKLGTLSLKGAKNLMNIGATTSETQKPQTTRQLRKRSLDPVSPNNPSPVMMTKKSIKDINGINSKGELQVAPVKELEMKVAPSGDSRKLPLKKQVKRLVDNSQSTRQMKRARNQSNKSASLKAETVLIKNERKNERANTRLQRVKKVPNRFLDAVFRPKLVRKQKELIKK